MPVSIADVENVVDTTGWNVQEIETLYARVNVVNYLSSLEVQKKAVFASDAMANFLVDTTPLDDATALLKKGCTMVLEHTKVGHKISQVAEGVRTAITSSRPAVALKNVADKAAKAVDELKRKIEALLEKFVSKMMSFFKKAYSDIAWVTSFVTEVTGWLVASLKADITNAIPAWAYVQSASDLYKGLKTTVQGVTDYVSLKLSGRGVDLKSGHPEIIARDLRSHMTAKALLGAKDAGVSVGKIALTATGDTIGIGSILSYAATALQKVFKLIDFIIQRVNLHRVLKKAKKEQANLLNCSSIALDGNRFNDWFCDSLALSPVLGALLMHSGAIAHPYSFLSLLDRLGRVRTDAQVQYTKGAEHIENMKKVSGKYIREYSGEYNVTFASDVAWQNELLKQQQELEGAHVITTDATRPEAHALKRQNAFRRQRPQLKRANAFRRKAVV